MAFEVKYETRAGLFHVRIEREVSAQEAHELAQLALNITAIAEVSPDEPVYGPRREVHPPMSRPDDDLVSHIRTGSNTTTTTKLGEKPVTEINLMDYREPKEGVRIKMCAFPQVPTARIEAVKSIRAHTGIGLIGCRNIVYGNVLCPILKPEIAAKIMADFRKLEIFAKIVPANDQTRAA